MSTDASEEYVSILGNPADGKESCFNGIPAVISKKIQLFINTVLGRANPITYLNMFMKE
jgi:hypothetical protein